MAVTDALGDANRVEVGYWLSSEEHPPDRIVEHAVAAEEAGFGTAMVSDHFHPWTPQQGNSGFVWTVLGAIARSTERLRVGTGVTAPIARLHPLVIAHAAATTEILMPGRFFLGLGAGERLNEQVVGGHWPTGRVRREMVEEAADVIRRLWRGKTVTHQGSHFTVERARLFSRPDTTPPIVIAAGGKKTAALAGRIGDGMLGVAPDPEVVDAFEAVAGPGKPRLAQLHVCWAGSEADARRTAHEWWPNGALPAPLLAELATPSQFAAATDLVTEDEVVDTIVVGPDPDPYRTVIDRYVAAGFTTVYLHQVGPDQLGFLDFCRRELLDLFAVTGRPPPIAAHRLLSDGRSTALVRPDGEIDWWCWPRMHSSPRCWSLLDPHGGRLRFPGAVHAESDDDPAGPVLTTCLRIDGRLVEIHDALLTDAGTSELVRLVRGVDRDLDVAHEAHLAPFEEHSDGETIELSAGGVTTTIGAQPVCSRLRAARGVWVAVLLAAPGHAHDAATLRNRIEAARARNERMLSRGRYPVANSNRGRDALAILHACTDVETGAVIASPTTSLPEVVGGNRNFDYRYSWLRDSSTAIATASMLGQRVLADRYTAYLDDLGPDGILASPLSVAAGGTLPDEREVEGIAGWAGSRPVRVGNAAGDQVQHDAIGLVLDALRVHTRLRDRMSSRRWEIVVALADRVADADPNEPTSGIWELRTPARLVSADIGRWLALDRALRLVRLRRPWALKWSWIRAHDEARARVLGAFLPSGALPRSYDDDHVDASGLLLVIHGLLRSRDPRAARLVDATISALGCGPLLYRYEPDGSDGFDPSEAPFVPACWWAVTALAVLARPEAVDRAEQLCATLPRLQPEEFDPTRGEALGNTPLLWAHAEAARALFEVDRFRSRHRRLVRRITGD